MKNPEIVHITKYRNGDRRYWMLAGDYAWSVVYPKAAKMKPKEMAKDARERIVLHD